MMRIFADAGLLVFVHALAIGCTSERAPRIASGSVRPLDPRVEHLRAVRATFARVANEPPGLALAMLLELRSHPVPPGLVADEAAFLGSEVDHELALVLLDAGRIDDATTAIERALGTAETMSERDPAFTAGLLLTAEAAYLRSGRVDSAAWAHREAALFVARDAGR